MFGAYQIWFTKASGERLALFETPALLDNTISFSMNKTANNIGSMTMTLPANFDMRLLQRDNMIQVWRSAVGGSIKLFQAYFLRRWKFNNDDAGFHITVTGHDPKSLLARRIVAYYSGESESSQSAITIDDLMRAIVRDAVSNSTNPALVAGTRVFPNFTVEADRSEADVIDRSFAWQELLSSSGGGILSALANSSRARGNEVFFDVTPTVSGDSIAFQFITRMGMPGADMTERVFGIDNGTLKNPSLEFDYTNEKNYIYVGGSGQGASRSIEQIYDADLYNASIFNRCESFYNAANQSTADSRDDCGYTALSDGRPRQRFYGEPVETPTMRYGMEWNYGDKVRVKYLGYNFDAIIRAVAITVENGNESIMARIESEVAI